MPSVFLVNKTLLALEINATGRPLYLQEEWAIETAVYGVLEVFLEYTAESLASAVEDFEAP